MMTDIQTRREEDVLRNRVISSIPATQYAFDTLLRLLDVTVTESVPTAAVRCGISPALLINPVFVAEHCHSDEALFMLVMHELHHVLLGHTRLFPRATRAHNFAFDAVINAHLSELFPQPEHTAFFRRYYAADVFPWFLLRPPPGWPAKPVWEAPQLASVPRNLVFLHRSLYTLTGVTYDEIFAALAELLKEETEGALGPILLGDHEADDAQDAFGTQHGDRQVLVAAIRAVVEKWPPPKNFQRGRSLHDAVLKELVPKEKLIPTAARVVKRAFAAAALGCSGRLNSRRQERLEVVSRPLPDPRDRRALVARTMGITPLFFETTHSVPKPGHGGRVHVYLDVSGSMNPYLPAVYAGLSAFAEDLFPKVHLFSTQVRDVTVSQLISGVRLTDGGTDIAPVIGHLLAHRVKRAVILTDGYTGSVDPADAALLRNRGVSLIALYTPNGWRRDLDPVASKTFELPPLS